MNSHVHRNDQFKQLQLYHDRGISMDKFNWHVKNLLLKCIIRGELFYLVRYLNTNMNAVNQNYEYPLQ